MGVLKGVLANKCPHCFQGSVFRGLLSLNKKCPHCDYLFVKEEGYYLGSMIAAYFFASFTVIPVFVIGSFFYHLEISTLIWIGSVQVVILSPILYRFATLLWLWLETRFDEVDQR